MRHRDHNLDKLDPSWVAEEEKENKRIRENKKKLDESFKKVLNTKEGKFVIDAIMEMSGFYMTPFKDEDLNFYMGRRHVGKMIYDIINKETKDD